MQSIAIRTHIVHRERKITLLTFRIGAVALAHQMNARPLGINLMIYNCWNYKWTMNRNLSFTKFILCTHTNAHNNAHNHRHTARRQRITFGLFATTFLLLLLFIVVIVVVVLIFSKFVSFFIKVLKFFMAFSFFCYMTNCERNKRKKTQSSEKRKWLTKFIHFPFFNVDYVHEFFIKLIANVATMATQQRRQIMYKINMLFV